MLKRHRQSTPPPPPSSSNIHLLPDLDVEAPEDRYAKRRRTQQPTLGSGSVGGYDQALDGDEDSYEDHHHATNAPGHESTEMTDMSKEYKSTNMMLRELHILNQHRLMFSPPPPNPFLMPQISSSTPPHQLPFVPPPNSYSTLTTKLHPTPMQTSKLSKPYSQRPKTAQQDQFQTGPLEEAGVVSENYENMNKLLGSLFLSRRRALDSSHGMPHL